MRVPIFFLALLGLSGCMDPVSNMVVGTATVSTFSVEGKGPVDLALSEIKDQDCDIRNPKKYDGHYCMDESAKTLPDTSARVYCHPTLGQPECTAQPDPHANGNTPYVGQGAAIQSKTVASGKVMPTPATGAVSGKTPPAPPISLTPDGASENKAAPKKKGSALQGS